MKKILITGGGSIGERHLRCFQKTRRADVGLCEVNPELLQRLTSDYGLTWTSSHFEEAMEQPWDGVVLCTPAHLHVDMALKLVSRQIPVLIEKPLSTTLSNAQELLDRTQALNVLAGVAYVYRSHPALSAMREALHSGRFGAPVEVVVTSGQHFPLYRPAYRDIYYNNRETGGGAIQDALTHLLNAGEWLAGPITRLVADAEHLVLDGVSVEDTVHVLTRHEDILGSYSLNQHQPVNESSLTLLCQRGCVRFEMHRHRWLSCQHPGDPWQIEEEFPLERDDLFLNQAHSFLDALEGRGDFPCPLTDGLQTLKVNLAALKSVDEQRWISLDRNMP